MTYWVDLPARYWSRGSERRQGQDLQLPLSRDTKEKEFVRPTLLALLREYGLGSALFETDIAGMRERLLEVVDASLDFQRQGTFTRRGRARTKYARILQLLEDEDAMRPMAVVAPYVQTTELTTEGVVDQARLNARSISARQSDESMWTILALGEGATLGPLSPDSVASLRLDEFDAVGLWVSDFDEYAEPASRLDAYRELIRSIPRPVWLMYGGYFGLLLGADGVDLVSHGVYYTESKRMQGPVGSGPPPERYYIPALHRFYEPTRAFRLIDLVPDFACNCDECPSLEGLRAEATAAAGSPARRTAWAQRLQRHFLNARTAEVQSVQKESLEDLLESLRAAEYAFSRVPDVDRAAIGVSVSHLTNWRTALAAA
jgi:hypothetical protein